MQKILNWTNEDFTKGISYQRDLPMGGLFLRASNFNPFEDMGVAVPSLTPATITPTTTPKFLTSFNTGGVGYVYYHTDTKLYQTLADSPYTQVEKTSEINITDDIIGAIIWNNRYIYAQAGATAFVYSNTLPVASASNVQIRANYPASASDYMPFAIGADANLYFGGIQGGYVGILTSETGTAGNAGSFTFGQSYIVRDLVNDGRYLVAIADNNALNNADRVVGNYKCKVMFWDMFKDTVDISYDIDDSYLIGAKILDGVIYVFGYNGIYACNSATPPRMVRPFNGNITHRPLNPSQIGVHNGSIFWLNGLNTTSSQEMYAYGHPITGQQKIFYSPYTNTNSGQTQKALAIVGEQIWVADSEPKIYVHNIGSTRSSMQLYSCNLTLPSQFRYEYTKIVLTKPMASGESVGVVVYGSDSVQTVSASETKSYSASNPRKELIFKRTPASGSIDKMDELFLTITTNASIKRVTVYATSLPETETM